MYGELIRNARQRKGWTLSDLAYKLGITPAGIAQWEQNRRNPKLETREKIASALDIDITELMLEPEKSDYEKRFGTSESRAASAAYQIERIIEANTKRIESCNGVVTTNHKKDWALDDIEVIARKYGVPTSSIKKQLNIDLSLGLDEAQTDSVPKSKTYYKGRFVSEIDAIMAGLPFCVMLVNLRKSQNIRKTTTRETIDTFVLENYPLSPPDAPTPFIFN